MVSLANNKLPAPEIPLVISAPPPGPGSPRERAQITQCAGRVAGRVSQGLASVPAMRMLHTSDWHLGRSLHRADLRQAQAAYLDHLVGVVRSEKVDAVLVAGDVYDRAIPPVDAVELCADGLARLRDAGARVVVISGNHDSAGRLGFGSALVDAAGVYLRTRAGAVAQPVMLEDRHGPVAVYGVPYLEPDAVRAELPPEPGRGEAGPGSPPSGSSPPRGHAGVLGRAVQCIRADVAARGGVRAVAMAHAWVAGGEASDSERDISVGGVGRVPATLFGGFSYVALGHLHGQQTLGPTLRYSGSPLPYSFSEARHAKGSWLVELNAGGAVRAERVPAPPFRALNVLRGRLADLLTSGRLRALRGRLPVGGPDRHEPAGGRDGKAADAVPAHPGAGLRARRRRRRHPQLPGQGRRPRRSDRRHRVRRARAQQPGHAGGAAAARGRPGRGTGQRSR